MESKELQPTQKAFPENKMSGSIDIVQEVLGKIEDFRVGNRIIYDIKEILLVIFAGISAGEVDFVNMKEYAEDRIEVLRGFLPFKQGIPSHDTLRRVMSVIDPEKFKTVFHEFCLEYQKIKIEHSKGEENHHVLAMDGKEVQGSKHASVNVYCSESDMLIATEAIEGKGGAEIHGLKKILTSMHVAGSVITFDAMGCQKEIVELIDQANGDYVLSLKENHPIFFKEVVAFFKSPTKFMAPDLKPCIFKTQTLEKDHGRIEKREIRTISVNGARIGASPWKGIQSVASITRHTTSIKTAKTTTQTSYYITSLPAEKVKKIGDSVRYHWGVENKAHWVLDVVFHEDDCPVRNSICSRNLQIMRSLVSNLVKTWQYRGRSSLSRKVRSIQRAPQALLEFLVHAGVPPITP